MKKNIKLFSTLLCCLAVMALSSCLGDSDSAADAEKEWKEWYEGFRAEVAASMGNYAGYVYFQPDVKTATLDSVAVQWDIISDSVIVLRDVPTRLFAQKLPENQSSIKEAINAVKTMDMRLKIVFDAYYKSPLLFYVFPEPVTMNITVDGQPKTAVVNFMNYNTADQSFGQVLVSNGQCLIKVYPDNIVVDNSPIKAFNSTDYAFLYWLGKKR